MAHPTEKQQETIEMLSCYIDNLGYDQDPYSIDFIVHGDSVDGPFVAYLAPDGKLNPLCGW